MARSAPARRTSNSNPSQPCRKARSKEARVFSGTVRDARAPRWPRSRGRLGIQGVIVREKKSGFLCNIGGKLVQVDVADGLASVRRFFCFFYRFLKFLF